MSRLQLWLETRSQSFLESVVFSFFFGQKLCNCQINAGRLQPLWPLCSAGVSRPRSCIYSLRKFLLEYWFQFHWFCSASCSFSPYTSKFSFSNYFVMSTTEIYSNLKATCRYKSMENNIQKSWLRNSNPFQLSKSRFARLGRNANLSPYHLADMLMRCPWKTYLERVTLLSPFSFPYSTNPQNCCLSLVIWTDLDRLIS